MQSVTPKNGTITFPLPGEPGWQTICVSDTGTGMSEEMRKNALKGYVSADKDYWRHGIGLYVCHQIITARRQNMAEKQRR
ncbi:MAG: ATP-binding protein [Blautia obeum]